MQLTMMLNEICKFSAMHATTALSKFLKIPIGVDIKLVEIHNIEDISLLDKGKDKSVSIFLPIIGDLPGASFFIYSEKAALSLCDVLFQKPDGTTHEISEPEVSALSEVANIVIGNFLTSFAQSLQMDMLMHKSPIFDWAPFPKILQKRLQVMKEKMQKAVLSISFGFKHTNIYGHVIVVFSEEKINAALKKVSTPSNI